MLELHRKKVQSAQDDIGERVYLDNMQGLNLSLADEVVRIIRKSPRAMRKRKIAAEKLSEVCSGVVSSLAAFRVINLYAKTDLEMSFHCEEISLHLSRIQARNKKIIASYAMIDDVLFGPCFKNMPVPKWLLGRRRGEWGEEDGFEAFRRVLLEDEPQMVGHGDGWIKRMSPLQKMEVELRMIGGQMS